MKRILPGALALALGACASDGLPTIENSTPPPMPKSQGALLPGIDNLSTPGKKQRGPGRRSPQKSEMIGSTWTPDYHRDNEYIIPVGTTDSTGMRPVQQTMICSDMPVGAVSISNKGFEAANLGQCVAIAPKAGAPVGIQVRGSIQFGGMIVKLVLQPVATMGLSEMRLQSKPRAPDAGMSACMDTNYRVDRVITGGPMGACTVVTASRAGTATYFTLPANTQEGPVVSVRSNTLDETMRLARTKITKLPTGQLLVAVQGSWPQLVLDYPGGGRVTMTRGS